MKIVFLFVLFVSFVLTGCQSTSTKSVTQVPRWGNTVEVALYDKTPRDINPEFEVFGREADVPRKFKVIALVSRQANPEDETLMMNAITWRAKQIGADAMIVLDPIIFTGREQPRFRAHAIVWTSP